MGSPRAELYSDHASDFAEHRHRVRINRSFAICTKEVTVEDFLAFRKSRETSWQDTEPDYPFPFANWNDAAAYCNWLSEQDGIPRDEWCYDPDAHFDDGMTLYPEYFHRRGYRLPTEAEWEFACRAGTSTSRPYGESDDLLKNYVCKMRFGGPEWLLPVGSLKPNDLGLFDMLGSVQEWCQGQPRAYKLSLLGAPREVLEDHVPVRPTDWRLTRGGATESSESDLRSAARSSFFSDSDSHSGIRVARSYTDPP
jgi:hypothetical protein